MHAQIVTLLFNC